MSDAMTSAWVEVLPDFQDFRRKANSEMTGILGPAGDEGGRRAGQGVGNGLVAGIGKLALPIAGAFAAIGIGQIVGDAVAAGVQYAFEGIDLASDLSETRSAVDQIFGDASAAVQKFADSAVENLGQTEQEALSAAQTFGVFGKSAGLSGDDLATFTTGLVGLSADIASFNNTDSTTAIDALGAGLRGESEPLRQFGIMLDDATLKNRALALGIYDGNGALTSQQRVLASQAEIYAQTSLQQGDVARTSEGLAFQQKQLGAAFEQAKTSLGEALLPALTTLVLLLNDEIVPVLNETIDSVGPVLADALAKSAPAFADLLVAIAPLIPPLVQLAVEALPPLLEALIAISPLLIDMASNAAANQTILNALFALLAGDTSFATFAETVSNVGGSVSDFSSGVAGSITSVNQSLASFARETQLNIGNAIGIISSIPQKAAAGLGNIGRTLYSSGRDLIQGFINGINDMLAPVRRAVDSIMSTVAGFFPNSPAEYGPFSGSGWTGVRNSGGALFDQFNEGFGGGQLALAGVDVSRITAGRVPSSVSVGAGGGALPNIYVQNPFTGEYLLAKVDGRAQGVVSAAGRADQAVVSAGRRVDY